MRARAYTLACFDKKRGIGPKLKTHNSIEEKKTFEKLDPSIPPRTADQHPTGLSPEGQPRGMVQNVTNSDAPGKESHRKKCHRGASYPTPHSEFLQMFSIHTSKGSLPFGAAASDRQGARH